MRHGQKLGLEAAQQHIRLLDEGRHFIEQGFVFDRRQTFFRRGRPKLSDKFSAALGKARNHRAFAAQLLGVAVGAAQRDVGGGRLETVAVRHPARMQPECRHSDRLVTVQSHQAMRRPHEIHAGPAVGQLVLHELGNRQLGNGLGQRFLQTVGKRGAAGQAVEEQRFGLAVGRAFELRHGVGISAQRSELFQQRGCGLARGVQRHGHRHELDLLCLVSGLG